jgi:hypothetical protein
MNKQHEDGGRVYTKISRAIEGELTTNIIGACAAVIIDAIVDSAPSLDIALSAFDAFVQLTRERLVEAWNTENEDG